MLVVALLLTLMERPTRACGEQAKAQPLSLVRIDMDICGMGQFVFEGMVAPGDQFSYAVPLAELSDVLRNLVINDPENAVQYARVDSLLNDAESAARLAATSTFGELLVSMRGEEVAIAQLDGGSLSGRIISVERQPTEDDSDAATLLLTLATENGIQCLALERIKSVLPVREAMNAKLEAALNHHVAANEEEYRTIEVGFAGSESRSVSIRLTRPLPLWRTTYSFADSRLQQRIVFDNCTREAWNDVSIHFTDRSPVVFQTPLYEVVRSARPVVSMPDRHLEVPFTAAESLSAFMPEQEPPENQLVLADKHGGGFGGGGGMGMGGGQQSGLPTWGLATEGQGHDGALSAPTPSHRPPPESRWAQLPIDTGSPFAILFTGLSIEPQKTHVVTTPNLDIETERLSYYRREHHPEKPLASLLIINRMPFRLPAGPMTVFDELGNVGEAMLVTMAPNVRQLVSFSVDGELKIRHQLKPESTESHALAIDDARFRIDETTGLSRVHEYSIENRSKQAKVLLIEHPKPTGGWMINRSDALEEETDVSTRFRMRPQAEGSMDFLVDERCTRTARHSFPSLTVTQLQNWLDDPLIAADSKTRIRVLLDLHQQLAMAKKKTDDIATALGLEKAEVSRIVGLLKSRVFDNSNAENYEAKIAACEAHITLWEAEEKIVAKQGIALLKRLGITEPSSVQDGPFRLDRRRWLDASPDPFGGE